ncbi:MAG: hypothetical protein J0G99_04920 [Alphaproteobacteria bacterium]|nr:hypothetical protein [Alphaproteobacteria bacterium]
MTKKKLIEDIKQNPARIYRLPADVLRDRRFDDAERLEILEAWDAVSGAGEIASLIAELKARMDQHDGAAHGHAAE